MLLLLRSKKYRNKGMPMKKSYRVKKKKNFNRCLIKTILCKSSFRGVRFRETTTSPFSSGDFCWEENWKRGHKKCCEAENPREFISIKDRISPEIDFIVIARPGLEKLSSEEVKANLTHVLNLAKILDVREGE